MCFLHHLLVSSFRSFSRAARVKSFICCSARYDRPIARGLLQAPIFRCSKNHSRRRSGHDALQDGAPRKCRCFVCRAARRASRTGRAIHQDFDAGLAARQQKTDDRCPSWTSDSLKDETEG
jgi:hypothetical protein